MGMMEETIVAELVFLRDEETLDAEPMFVFPLSLMATPWTTLGPAHGTRRGEVARFSRPDPAGRR